MSDPESASATSETENGLDVVRAPTQTMSTPASSAASAWCAQATSRGGPHSVRTGAPVSHARAVLPTPSNESGRDLPFHTPARRVSTPRAANPAAVSRSCASLSALQGPATSDRDVATAGPRTLVRSSRSSLTRRLAGALSRTLV